MGEDVAAGSVLVDNQPCELAVCKQFVEQVVAMVDDSKGLAGEAPRGWPGMRSMSSCRDARADQHNRRQNVSARPGGQAIIDPVAAAEAGRVAAWEGDLRLLGYGPHDAGMPGRPLYRCGPANARTHSPHLGQASTLTTRNQVWLRDYLSGHPDDAARYGARKRRLAALHNDGNDYSRAKPALIQELTDKARAERGLPPAPVLGGVNGVREVNDADARTIT